jgi:hypothetical protein
MRQTRRSFVMNLLSGLGGLAVGCKPLAFKGKGMQNSQSQDASEGDSDESPESRQATDKASTPTSRVRRNIWQLTSESPDIVYLKAGIEVMKLIPADHPEYGHLGWTGQSEVHRLACPHGNHFFLPCHRVYLYYFEKTVDFFAKQLRSYLLDKSDESVIFAKGITAPELTKEHATLLTAIDHNFALPYWDWSFPDSGDGKNIKVMELVLTDPVLDATKWKDPLVERQISPEPMDPVWASKAAVAKLVEIDSFNVFASGRAPGQRDTEERDYGELEGTVHNEGHNYIGGTLRRIPVSALDPIFWMHHCNLDRLWETWMQYHNFDPAIVHPAEKVAEWKEYKLYEFYDLANKPQKHPVQSVLDLKKMDFLGMPVSYEELVIDVSQQKKLVDEATNAKPPLAPAYVDAGLITVSQAAEKHILSIQIAEGQVKKDFLERLKNFKAHPRKTSLTFRGVPEPSEDMPFDHLKFYVQAGSPTSEPFLISTYGFFDSHHETVNVSSEVSTKLYSLEKSEDIRSQGGLEQIHGIGFQIAFFKTETNQQRTRSYLPVTEISPDILTKLHNLRLELR